MLKMAVPAGVLPSLITICAWSGGIAGDRLARHSAAGAKASARRERTSAGSAGVARVICITSIRITFVRVTGCRQVLSGGRAARHAMDRFHGRSDSFGVRLRPAKVAGEPLKKFFDLLAFDGLVFFGIGRIRLVCGHGNLIADIVGEFGC